MEQLNKIFLIFILVCTVFLEAKAAKDDEIIVDSGDDDEIGVKNIFKPKIDEKNENLVFGDIKIPHYYSKLEIPSYSKSKLKQLNITEDNFQNFTILVYVSVRSIGDVDEKEEEVTVEIDFIASWMDTVIFAENLHLFNEFLDMTNEDILTNMKTMDPAFLQYIWKPDLFIENVVSVKRPSIIVKPIKVLFNPLGFIIFATRLTVTLDCKMEFIYYPADTQTCDFKIRSYSHTRKELNLDWLDTGAYISDRDEHNFDVQILNVTKIIVTEAEGLLMENYSESYDVLVFTIAARRSLSYHLIQTYLPSMFFIIITWLCFLIPVAMVEARIGVAMTTLLTLTSMFSSVRESTPVVSYIKAIDFWMVCCIFFVFSTLLEFTILVFMRHVNLEDIAEHEEQKDAIEFDQEEQLNPKKEEDNENVVREEFNENFFVRLRKMRSRRDSTATTMSKKIQRRKKVAILIEYYAFTVFFVAFLIFNLIYWPWLLISSKYFSWNVNPQHNRI